MISTRLFFLSLFEQTPYGSIRLSSYIVVLLNLLTSFMHDFAP